MTWIKICGTTNLGDAAASIAAGADALGFIFAPSPRRIEVTKAREISRAIGNQAEKIGVFVNETPEHVRDVAERVGLTGVQLHGEESPTLISEFRQMLGDRKIIKTLQAQRLLRAEDSQGWAEGFKRAKSSVDVILLDSGLGERRGGTGVPFSWQEASVIATSIKSDMPLVIAGGLHADNVQEALRLFNPWGVDVVTGVETSPGKKDDAKLHAFVAAVRVVNDRVHVRR